MQALVVKIRKVRNFLVEPSHQKFDKSSLFEVEEQKSQYRPLPSNLTAFDFCEVIGEKNQSLIRTIIPRRLNFDRTKHKLYV